MTLCRAAQVVTRYSIFSSEHWSETSTRCDSTAQQSKVQLHGGVAQQAFFTPNSLWQVAILRLRMPCSAVSLWAL